MKGSGGLNWDGNYDKAFEKLKTAINQVPILVGSTTEKPFRGFADALQTAGTGMLTQLDESGNDRVILFF